MEAKYLIYMHTAPNGKSYIGQTCNLQKRNHGHQTKAACRAIHNAIQKYGWDNFNHEILAENLSLEEANKLEQRLIAAHNTLSPNGYNLRAGGNSGGRHSDEAKAKQRQAKLGKKHSPESIKKISQASKNQSVETREKQRKARLGRKHSDETKAKIAASKIGKKRPQDVCDKIRAAKQNMPAEVRAKISASLKGRKASDETRAKQSEARKGRIKSDAERAKLSATLAGRKFSEDTRSRMSESAKRRVAEGRNALIQKRKEAAHSDLFGDHLTD